MSSSSAPDASRPICVLSVGRSGSSLATRALNLLGVHLGAEEDLLEANSQNELGFWENNAIYRLNEQLLEAFGGNWYRPPDLPLGWEHDARVDEFRERAATVVAGLASAHTASAQTGRWGFKDPRSVVLLPFWRQIVGEMDYVICVRRASEVIPSVRITGLHGAEPKATERLWLDVNAKAVARTVGERRTFVFYEDWFEDARTVAQSLAEFVHGEGVTADSQVLDSVESFFRHDLRRSHEQDEAAEPPAPELDAMYEHLRLIAARASEDPETQAREAQVAQALADGHRVRQDLHNDVLQAQEQAARSSEEVQASLERAYALERARSELQEQLARHQQWLDGIQGSASWRMTAPLRVAKRRLRQVQGAGLRGPSH